MDELLELARDAYEKAKIMYETATEIADGKPGIKQNKQGNRKLA